MLFRSQKIKNLALAGIFVFYFALVGQYVIHEDYCANLGFDFCAYWSGGNVANEFGFSEIYNSEKLLEVQTNIYPEVLKTNGTFEVVPLPYLPFFLIPFKFFSYIDLRLSYMIWTLLNFLVSIFTFAFFFPK
mgnify:FL=1